ncbi:2-oxoacid:ferredoxin oxidoreductase, gamma subunit [Caldisphaera lagunensis DSM 15908]|uniref:2-oxoacid:ferredoxin oxidoreductase, gamma subunit n=1 Tax=Caldisphaera lagunensis (strain DSM 15908 / JCM 11604 / ANMR 0165 / IC-154) TaxID=1056495 RepID=L0A9A8_CALLD|nr:indolepyruvate oxidoreductase subunit beta [Caldisphaera lagunensis]AFZ70009.1 2-oxoacid:ferredoxin oxidoreductase, gamma subunit [Caldisphaera lagunensis DSM 15908]
MAMNSKLNIVISGVGGQGIVTLARIIGEAAVNNDVKVLIAETHGLSQRGGSVEVHVRLGNVYAPLVPKGGADILLSMELIESARNVDYLNKDGMVISSDTILRPPIPGVKLPKKEEIIKEFEKNNIKYYLIPTKELAEKIGSYQSENMILLGALYKFSQISKFINIDSIKESIKTMRNPEINIKAFELGNSL